MGHDDTLMVVSPPVAARLLDDTLFTVRCGNSSSEVFEEEHDKLVMANNKVIDFFSETNLIVINNVW